MTIKLNDEEISLLSAMQSFGTVIAEGDKKYFYFPFWLEETKEGYNLLSLADLPKELTDIIKSHRNGIDKCNPSDNT